MRRTWDKETLVIRATPPQTRHGLGQLGSGSAGEIPPYMSLTDLTCRSSLRQGVMISSGSAGDLLFVLSHLEAQSSFFVRGIEWWDDLSQ